MIGQKKVTMLPEMGSIEDISKMDPQIITEGYNEAKALKRSIKEAADILDEKAMKFIGFLVTIILALIAAFWALKVSANAIFLYLVAGEIVICIVSMLLLVFGVISGNSFMLAGERPEFFFEKSLMDWYDDLKKYNGAKPDAQFMAAQTSALTNDISHNEKALERIVKNYRLSIWILTVSSSVLGIVFLVLSCL